MDGIQIKETTSYTYLGNKIRLKGKMGNMRRAWKPEACIQGRFTDLSKNEVSNQ